MGLVVSTTPRWVSTCLVIVAIWLGCVLPSQGTGVQADPTTGALQQVTVKETGNRVVVTLVGDQTLDGSLEAVAVPPARIFVDLLNVRPDVDRVTDVNQGAVKRVRVALNQAQPLVTRVVLDLDGPLDAGTTYFLERGTMAHELRIVVDALPGSPDDAPSEYAKWFTKTSDTVARLLRKESDGLPGEAHELDDSSSLTLEWDELLTEVNDTIPPPTFEVAHSLLTTASTLGRVNAAAHTDGSVASTNASAATAGARLLLKRAQDRMTPQLASVLGSS